jgi:hypothetical protein
MAFQSQLKISSFKPAKQSMPYDITSVGEQSCAYDENQALKILKRPFGYFCGSGQKLPAQQSGKKVRNTKRLNGTQRK